MANSNEIKDKLLLTSGDIVDYSHERNAVKSSKIEEKNYASIDKAERVKAYNSNLFKKLSEFHPGEIYKYKDNKGKVYIKIIDKVEAKGELHIKYLTQDGEAHYKPASFFTEIPRKPKKIPTFPAANNRAARQPSIGISKGTEPVKAGYYIITDANCKEIGSIILIFNGATKMLNTDQNITETYKINQLKEIDRDEAFYLSKFPTNQSIEKWKSETFKQIRALTAGNDDCSYTKDIANIYHIKSKNITEKGIRFIIQRKGSAWTSRDADASEIELIQTEKGSDKSENLESPMAVPSIDRQTSSTSIASTDSKDNMNTRNVLPTILCDKLGVDVINPGAIDQIKIPNGARMNKYIAIEGTTKSFVKLHWKGKINNINCLGCELPEYWIDGTDGSFGRHKLFTCSYGKGVLIPMNDDIKSCESDDEPNHLPLDENDDLRADKICCFEPLDKLSKDIAVDKRVFSQQFKCGGECKWLGLINGKEYVGISHDGSPRGGRGQELSRILKIYHQIRFVPIECVEILRLHFSLDKIVDLNKIFEVKYEEYKEYLGKPAIIGLTMMGSNTKQFIGELKWTGKINNEKCAGLDMEIDFDFGMDGIINQEHKFECMKKHGLITVLSNVNLYNYDKKVPMLPSGIIYPDKYLKCRETGDDKYLKARQIKKGEMVTVKLLDGQVKLKGILKWSGSMNNVPVCAVELLQEHENGTNGRFWRTQLFECPAKRAIAALPENLSPKLPMNLINNKFVERNQKEFFSNVPCTDDDIYHVGQFIRILPFDLFGKIECFHIVYGERFVEIQLTKNQIKALPFHERIDRDPCNAIYSTVILLEDDIAKCSENLEFLSKSPLIYQKCIEYKIPYPMETFQKKDLIKVRKDGNVKYFFVVGRFIINGNSCLSVIESILGSTEEYIREADVSKVDDSELELKYFQDLFIAPKSILSFEKQEIKDFSIGNRVEFKTKDYNSSYQGIIKGFGMVNKTVVSCAVQMLAFDPKVNRILSQYSLNEDSKFKHLIGTEKNPLLLIPANLLKKLDLPEIVNSIPVINPEFIRNTMGTAVEPERFIIFYCNNERRFAKLKWKGIIDQKYCLGCVANFQSNFGTNGTFGNDKLFTCDDKYGILIPIDVLSNCCELEGHKPIKLTRDGAIDANSICCVVEKNTKKFQTNGKLINIKSKKKAIWKWSGLVNDVEVIGVEMKEPLEKGTNGNFCEIPLFRSSQNRGALFEAGQFTSLQSELKFLKEINLNVVDPFNVREIENGRQINKSTCYKIKSVMKTINIKWRGIVNGELCIGCELSGAVEYGTGGTFGNQNLFNCPEGRGVLIPTDELKDSCEATTTHADIVTLPAGSFWGLNRNTYFIDADCICCIESIKSLQKHPHLRIKSRVKIPNKENKQNGGLCEWIGLINGQETVGVAMDNDVRGTNGNFNFFRMFTCEIGKGVLVLAENIFHDRESEKLQFIADKIVDTNKIFNISPCEGENGISIGKPIKIHLKPSNGRNRDFIGEVKWIGMINSQKCVGLDMEDEMEHGMDGRIKESYKFDCLKGHGLVTSLFDVELSETAEEPQVLDNGIIPANKFIRFKEEDSTRYLVEKNIKLNEFVFVKLNDSELKMRGKLRWFGYMNKLLVCVIELDQDHENGSDGTFWRRRIVKGRGKQVIATQLINVYKYEPYVKKVIPDESRIFKEIDINSAVKYYYENDTGFQDLFGTVKWTGVDEYGDYYFGLELDDRISIGTDGTFKGERLFVCQSGHGILAPLNRVGRDARFIEKNIPPEKVKMSECCDQIVYGLNSNIIAGENKGIQGNANSCYFDSALFALFVKSDVLDYLFSPMINEHEPDPITKEFRNIVAWKIVYPLRKNGFVSFHHTNEMRNVIQKYGPKFAEMMKQETDMENVSTLLSKLCPNEQLLSIISHNGSKTNSMFMQLFLTIPNKVPFMTSEEMLKISMVQNDIMFNELPTCLIMQAPRDAKGTNSYVNALPLKEIEISQICCNYFKKCAKCDNEAKFQCKMCLGNNLDITYTFQCSHHKCTHIECAKLRHDTVNSKSKVFMELQAIICIEKCHFVSFVKQVEKINEKQNDKNNEINWFFFDSMSSQSISNNYAVPKVLKAVKESNFLNNSKKEMENIISLYEPDDIKRIVKDSYIFIYHNKSKTCY